MAERYSQVWGIARTVFRFFTVYGPWGRPDMAMFKFVQGIRSGAPIDVYNNGEMERDFTYIDDLVEAVWRLTKVPPELGGAVLGDSMSPAAPLASGQHRSGRAGQIDGLHRRDGARAGPSGKAQ